MDELRREVLVEYLLLTYILVRPDKAPPQTCSMGLRLTFAAPVAGQLCLGYASHFGLGVFAGVQEMG
ncbi:MAG: hypothetical protein ACOYOU_04320 [Kiritimatiellia bacterium]